MTEILFIITALGGLFILFRLFFTRGSILLELEKRYTDLREYVVAVEKELKTQGRKVSYKGNREFIIDGELYYIQDWNMPASGFPVQRTVLRKVK
ncbi:hypothetical protein ACFSTA_17300 [Ornithinibacillus salinisoli]|uniref:Uncharacterized protein n=1 Tax=Ornithinibacillus salinisoli TaxID=1848459 RepID=A0ABW4W1Y5_9BACI